VFFSFAFIYFLYIVDGLCVFFQWDGVFVFAFPFVDDGVLFTIVYLTKLIIIG